MFSRNSLTTAEATELAERIGEIAATSYPLPEGLQAAASSVSNRRVRNGLLRISELLSRGTGIEQAVQQSVQGVPPFLIGILHVGAKQGKLPVVLTELSEHYRDSSAVRNQVSATLWYPIFVVVIFLALVSFMLTTIVPVFAVIFEDFDTEVPAATEFVIGLSRQFLPVVVPSIACFIPFVIAVRIFGGAANWSRLMCTVPAFGSLLRWSSFIELAQLLRLQVSQGVPIPEALRSSSLALRDANLANAAKTMAAQVDNGWSLADAMDSHTEVPGGISPILRWGETHNELPHAIDTISDLLSGRIRHRAAMINMILPPAMLIGVASCTLFLLSSILSPLVNLIQNLSR
ncbi:MAG: type II secretion system F family protein [Planctomycetales bacterium]|nr:type II secretion system F family protein [Planctomycetales bacterium]